MERDNIKAAMKNWNEPTPSMVTSATQDALDKLPEFKSYARRKSGIPRKAPLIAACACLLLTIMFFTPLGGIALAAIQNTFSYFTNRYNNDEQNQIFINLNEQGEQTSPPHVENASAAQDISAFVDGIYFDGSQLVLSYIIQGKANFDAAYQPTEQELALMRVLGPNEAVMLDFPEDMQEEWATLEQKRQNGQPVGWRSYDVSIGDHAYTDDGISVPPDADDHIWRGNEKVGVRFYNLQESLKERETLTLDVTFSINETRYYFDGEKEYVFFTRETQETVRVSAKKQKALKLAGSGSFDAYQAEASVTLSAVFTSVRIEVTPLGSTAVKKEWLSHYSSENDLQGVPLQYALYDENNNLLAENIMDTWGTGDSSILISGRISALNVLPSRLILMPVYVDGTLGEAESILISTQ